MNSQLVINKKRQPEPQKNLVEEAPPVQEGIKLSVIENQNITGPNLDLIGLSWIFLDDWSEL